MDNQPKEIESYFPYDGTYLDATIHNYTSYWRFGVAWEHTDLREPIDEAYIPTDISALQIMAINRYEKHLLTKQLQNMPETMPCV